MRTKKDNILKSEQNYIDLQKRVEQMPEEMQHFYTYQLSIAKTQAEHDKTERAKKREVQRAMVIARRWDGFVSGIFLMLGGIALFIMMFFLCSIDYWVDVLFSMF